MTEYLLLAAKEHYLKNTLMQAYLSEGYCLAYEKDGYIILRKGEYLEKEEVLLSVIVSHAKRRRFLTSSPSCLTSLINRHHSRLLTDGFQSLKFNDPFLMEMKQLLTQLTLP